MDDKQLEALLEDSFQRSVESQVGRLEGLESRVLQRLTPRLAPRTARQGWLSFPRWRLSLAFAATAAVALVVGLFVGNFWGLPLGDGTNQGITFVVAMPEARSVAVIGDFSNWKPLPLGESKGGTWSLNLDLPPGRYEYAFVIDGMTWKPDPRADEYVESYSSINSVKYVGAKREAS